MLNEERKAPHAGRRKGAGKYQHYEINRFQNSSQEGIQGFKAALSDAGLSTQDAITPDGCLHRFQVEGDSAGSRNGWYVLFGDDILAGAFGSWRTGETFKWCSKIDRYMTQAERTASRRRMNEAQKAREAEDATRKKAAAIKAVSIWKGALPASEDHPYLIKKGVRSHGLRLHNGAIVLPLRDEVGVLHSLQFISDDGNKRFLSGGRIAGCYFPIGIPTGTLCIAEGYATGASIHEATGHAVAVAFNAGNLLSVSQTLRRKFPAIKLVLCADNDTKTEGNPGLSKARKAAAAVDALLAVPPCHGDFNDLLHGEAQ